MQPIIGQQGSLQQFDDSYAGAIINQNSHAVTRVIFLVIGIILLSITISIATRRKGKCEKL